MNAETSQTLSAFTLPSEGPDHLLARINRTGLFGGSNRELVSFQFEEPDLGRASQNLVPREIDVGCKFVSVDREFAGVDHQRFEERGRVRIVRCRLAIWSGDHERRVSVRCEECPALRIGAKW